jgi:hypothetical protein
MRGAAAPGQAQDGVRAWRPVWTGVYNATSVVAASIFEAPDTSPCASTGPVTHYLLGVVGLERTHAPALNSDLNKYRL